MFSFSIKTGKCDGYGSRETALLNLKTQVLRGSYTEGIWIRYFLQAAATSAPALLKLISNLATILRTSPFIAIYL